MIHFVLFFKLIIKRKLKRKKKKVNQIFLRKQRVKHQGVLNERVYHHLDSFTIINHMCRKINIKLAQN